MKFAAFCIKHRVTTIMACVMVAIFGTMGFTSLPLALLPDMDLPVALVFSTYNAGPQEVESLVTRTLEGACASVSGMEELNSISSEGTSIVVLTFADGTDLDAALTDLRENIDMVSAYLPDDASSPMVMALDMDAMPVAVLALTGSDLPTLQATADDIVSPALERISGVASVDIMGGYSNQITVETFSEKLAGYGISLSQISQTLAAENISLPAGNVNSGANTLTVRTDGEFATVEEIEDTLLMLPTGGTIRLGEVADVFIEPETQATHAIVNGQESVILSISKQSGVNTVEVAEDVMAEMEELTTENPEVDWVCVMDQSDFINQSVDSAITNILFGVIFAALVLLVFLRDWGATLVIAITMPMCIVAVFLVMQLLGITLNMMSLGGVAMGVGMIVDNSIVVLENIFHYKADGANNYEACTQGTGEVALSISASTLTTIAVFLPLGLTDGIVGMIFYDFCLTICTLIATSLVVSLTIVPVLCYRLLGHSKRDKEKMSAIVESTKPTSFTSRFLDGYRNSLNYFINHRVKAMVISVALVAVFGLSIITAGFEMIPSMDQGSVAISVTVPIGAEIQESMLITERVMDVVNETVPEMESNYFTIGSAGMSTSTTNDSSVTINLVDKADRTRSADEIASQLQEDIAHIAGADISVSSSGGMDMSSMTGSAISLTLSGDDDDVLEETANDLVAKISQIPDATNVETSASEQVPEVVISLRRDIAAAYGLTSYTVGVDVLSQLSGSSATTLKVDGEELSVKVKGDAGAGDSLDALKSMSITTPFGTSIPLNMVADVTVEMSPQTINRTNQERVLTISGDSRSDDAAGIAQSMEALLASYQLPDGVHVDMGGEMEETMESFASLGYALVVALGLVFFVLASQFESFLMPIIIMMILPVGLIGSLSTQVFFDMKISIISFVGVIMLSGVVVNSSIVLVDYIKIRRQRGESKNDAILNACPRRVRPVLMTAMTTILGLIPMAISTGEGAEMMQPMAIVMMTGMVVATIVTLLFTPVYYSIIDSFEARLFPNSKQEELPDVENQPTAEN